MSVPLEDRFCGTIEVARRVAGRFLMSGEDVAGFWAFCGEPRHAPEHGRRAVLVRRHPHGFYAVQFEPVCGCEPGEVAAAFESWRRELDGAA